MENPSSPYIAAFDLKDQRRVYNGRPDKDGAFTLYLPEGARYDLSVEPEKDNYTFYSKTYDFTSDVPMSDRVEAEIRPVAKGTTLDLGIAFEPNSSQPSPLSAQSLRRLGRMVKGNPNRKFMLGITLKGYLADSIPSSPDLTEVRMDTLHFSVPRVVLDTVKLDSLLTLVNEQGSLMGAQADSTMAVAGTTVGAQIDSIREKALMTILVDSMAIKKTYHNNRTEAQAHSIINFLTGEGANGQNIGFTTKALPEPVAENRKTIVTVSVVE